MSRAVHLEQLAVANFRTKHLSQDILDWKERAQIAVAESCQRQVYFGLANDFANFPTLQGNAMRYRTAGEAYEFLLRLACGMESERIREDSIKGQLFQGWGLFQTDDAEKHKKLESIMQDVKADSRFVSAAAFADYKHQTYEIVARDLSGQAKGERILMVGSVNAQGKVSDCTDNMARVTGNERSNRVSEIMVTHPDAKSLRILYDDMMSLKKRGIVAADIVRVPFSKFNETIEQADHVYVALPMGANANADEYMINAWQGRIYKGNNLIHLRGNSDLRGSTSPLWQQADLQSAILPEAIREEMRVRIEHNQKAYAQAERVIDFCVGMREQGLHPSHSKIRHHLEGSEGQSEQSSLAQAFSAPAPSV